MSRMNAGIKCGLMLANCALAIIALFTTLAAVLVLTGQWEDFDPETFQTFATWSLVIGVCLLMVTMLGCLGAINQIDRSSFCTGRMLLGYYQILIIVVLIVLVRLQVEGKNTLDSIEFTLDSDDTSLEYDKFEKIIAPKFNTNYFNDLCSEYPSSGWFFTWVDKKCPATMSSTQCTLGSDWEACDTSSNGSCPSENVCEVAMDNIDNNFNAGDLDNCAYQRCRFEVLTFILDEMEPVLEILETTVYILLAMIFLTCLLICYNPQDDDRKVLEKTGVLVEHAPRAKKKKPPSDNRRRSTQSSRPGSGHRNSRL